MYIIAGQGYMHLRWHFCVLERGELKEYSLSSRSKSSPLLTFTLAYILSPRIRWAVPVDTVRMVILPVADCHRYKASSPKTSLVVRLSDTTKKQISGAETIKERNRIVKLGR